SRGEAGALLGHLEALGLHASDVILIDGARPEPREDGEHVGYALLLGVLLASALGNLEGIVGLLGLGGTLADQGEVMRRGLGTASERCSEQADGKSSPFDPRHAKSRVLLTASMPFGALTRGEASALGRPLAGTISRKSWGRKMKSALPPEGDLQAAEARA